MRMRKFLRKLHSWIGAIAALWLIMLSTTGILLQHSNDWGLEKNFIENTRILKAYGIGEQFIAFEQSNKTLIQIDGQIILDDVVSIKLNEVITSAIHHQQNWIVATADKLYWLNNKGQIIQSLDEIDRLPTPVTHIGKDIDTLYLQSNNKTYDLQHLKVKTISIQWPKPSKNLQLKQQAIALTSQDYLSVEKFIFDLHAAITTNIIFNDIAAIALIILSISGLIIFFKKSNKSKISKAKIK